MCPLCGRRRAKRACPALGRDICAVCCGTKRLVEIRCPPDCGYLASSRQHPPAVVQRRQERDLRFLIPHLQELSEAQVHLFNLIQTIILKHQPAAFVPLTDRDIAQASGALAGTLETEDRGIIYQHSTESLPAQRLLGEIRDALDELAKRAGRSVSRDAARVLRRVERAAQGASAALDGGASDYLEVIRRLHDAAGPLEGGRPAGESGEEQAPRLIVP